jgi:hypothetical protein
MSPTELWLTVEEQWRNSDKQYQNSVLQPQEYVFYADRRYGAGHS